MRQYTEYQQPEDSVFGGAFNLHPLDSLSLLQATHEHLRQFTYGFKERIQAEIQYSKKLIKVSKVLSKHINVARPSPISYISSAFKVQHELRARNALQLAQYLHCQIEIPCEQLLKQSESKIKQMNQDFKKQYKQGSNVEQTYQKYLKKYHRSRQDWEERMITKTIFPYVPGSSQSQIQKARAKLVQQKDQNAQILNRYQQSLEGFNKFAKKFNQTISQIILSVETASKKQLSLESNSLRKLIVSEINMFKNIEFDLINISKQMEYIKPNEQLEIFMKENASFFDNPIISIYSEGPISENNQHSIDYKYPITRQVLEETLRKIQRKHFTWMLENKHNSTFKYSLLQAWKKFEGLESEDFMKDLEQCVTTNKVVKQIPGDGNQKHYLNTEEAFSVSFSIVTNLASFIRPLQLTQSEQNQIISQLRSQFATHHFYRFFATASLQQFLNLRQNIIQSKLQEQRLVLIIKLLIEQCIANKDIFVIRLLLTFMFSTQLGPSRLPLFAKSTLLDNDIWSSNEFWESILLQATFQQICLLSPVSKEQLKQIYLMRVKNIVFSTLATYLHYMVMIGCQLKQVKDIAGRFCDIYSLNQEHERDLSKMLRSSKQNLAKLTQELSQSDKEIESEKQNMSMSEITTIQQPQQVSFTEKVEKNKESTEIEQLQQNVKSTEVALLKKKQSSQQEKSTIQNLSLQKTAQIYKSQVVQ